MKILIVGEQGEHKDYYAFFEGKWRKVYCDILTGGKTEFGMHCDRPETLSKKPQDVKRKDIEKLGDDIEAEIMQSMLYFYKY
jgi:hypothetical protein